MNRETGAALTPPMGGVCRLFVQASRLFVQICSYFVLRQLLPAAAVVLQGLAAATALGVAQNKLALRSPARPSAERPVSRPAYRCWLAAMRRTLAANTKKRPAHPAGAAGLYGQSGLAMPQAAMRRRRRATPPTTRPPSSIIATLAGSGTTEMEAPGTFS